MALPVLVPKQTLRRRSLSGRSTTKVISDEIFVHGFRGNGGRPHEVVPNRQKRLLSENWQWPNTNLCSFHTPTHFDDNLRRFRPSCTLPMDIVGGLFFATSETAACHQHASLSRTSFDDIGGGCPTQLFAQACQQKSWRHSTWTSNLPLPTKMQKFQPELHLGETILQGRPVALSTTAESANWWRQGGATRTCSFSGKEQSEPDELLGRNCLHSRALKLVL